MIWLVAKCRF